MISTQKSRVAVVNQHSNTMLTETSVDITLGTRLHSIVLAVTSTCHIPVSRQLVNTKDVTDLCQSPAEMVYHVCSQAQQWVASTKLWYPRCRSSRTWRGNETVVTPAVNTRSHVLVVIKSSAKTFTPDNLQCMSKHRRHVTWPITDSHVTWLITDRRYVTWPITDRCHITCSMSMFRPISDAVMSRMSSRNWAIQSLMTGNRVTRSLIIYTFTKETSKTASSNSLRYLTLSTDKWLNWEVYMYVLAENFP